ncbi:monocarboxylate transporter 13-like [Antedon mediterranea]|uniref:monocarboxylate transporter 13-like n=1 Tax=Antedon mediterranea TaxID=105859 RepID=UPI003AF587BD
MRCDHVHKQSEEADKCLSCTCSCNLSHNRWIKTIFCALLNFVHIGFLYNFGLFFDELMQTFHSSAAITGWIGSLSYCFFTFGSILTTWMLRHLSYRTVGMIGVLTGSVSLLVSSFSPTIVYVIVSYGVFFGWSSNVALVVTIETQVILYQDKWRASALTMVGLGATIGNLSMSNLIEYVIQQIGWRWTFRIFALILLVVETICCSFLASKKVCDHNIEDKDTKNKITKREPTATRHVICWPEVWLFSIATLSYCIAMVFHYVNMGSFFESIGLVDQMSATGIMLMALGDASAKILIIFAAPCIVIPLIYTLPVCILVSAIMSLALTWTRNPIVIFVLSFCTGLPRGVYNALQFPSGLEIFGTNKSKTTVNVLHIWNGLGSLVGPFIFGSLYDASGTYYLALYLCSALYVLSCITMLLTPLYQKYFAPSRYLVDTKKKNVAEIYHNLAIEYVYLEEKITVV